MKRTLGPPPSPPPTHTYAHGLHFQSGHVGWVSMGNAAPSRRESRTSPTCPTSWRAAWSPAGSGVRVVGAHPLGPGGTCSWQVGLCKSCLVLKNFQFSPSQPRPAVGQRHVKSLSRLPAAPLPVRWGLPPASQLRLRSRDSESLTRLLQGVCSLHGGTCQPEHGAVEEVTFEAERQEVWALLSLSQLRFLS